MWKSVNTIVNSPLTGKEVVVSGDYAVLTFHKEHNVQKKGFRIFFSAISGKCCGKAA